jgi:hypothetical protein
MKMALTTAAGNGLAVHLHHLRSAHMPWSRHGSVMIQSSLTGAGPLLRYSFWRRTCQWTLPQQQVLCDIGYGRALAQALLGREGESEQQASAPGEDEVEADKDHHQFGRHGGQRAGNGPGERRRASRGVHSRWLLGKRMEEPSGELASSDDGKKKCKTR